MAKTSITRNVFENLIADLWKVYKDKLVEIERSNKANFKKEHQEDIDKIMQVENLLDEKQIQRGLNKHIFAKFNTYEEERNYYSIRGIIEKELKEIECTDYPNMGDYLYKRCLEYKKGISQLEVFDYLFKVIGYNDINDYCGKNGLDNKSLELSRNDKIEEKLKGNWWLYFYNNEDSVQEASIATAVFEVKSLDYIKIYNYVSDTSLNYIGQIDNNLNEIEGVLYLKFEPENKREVRNLRIALHISEDAKLDIAIGQYTNVDRSTNLIRGSLGLQMLNEDQNDRFNKAISDEKKIQNFIVNNKKIDPSILKFFTNKDLNFNRLPNRLYQLDTFGSWLDVQRIKRLHQRRPVESKKLFISCPITSISDDDTFLKVKESVKGIASYFKETLSFSEVFAEIEGLEKRDDKIKKPSFFEYKKMMKDFNKCSHHLVIWPKKFSRPTGILFEIGLSAMINRPVTIFEQEDSELPHNVIGACDAKDSSIIKIPFREYDNIIEIIKELRVLDQVFHELLITSVL